jgi:hypothetical protein
MILSGLPPAKNNNINLKFGTLTLKTEIPSEPPREIEISIKILEEAAKNNVFNDDVPLSSDNS